jgi:translation initiation factor 2 subunit 3
MEEEEYLNNGYIRDNDGFMHYIQNQPTINIGMLGHVSNGKTTIVNHLAQTDTKRFKSEQEGNKTIKLGYANTKLWKCAGCDEPVCYQSSSSNIMELNCKYCCEPCELKKHISFVDCPGHNTLMATMMNGTSVMDSTIIIESASNNTIPAPQTSEHLIAAMIMELSTTCACFNKADLVNKETLLNKIGNFQEYLTTMENRLPIIPMSANFGINTDILIQHLVNLPDPERDILSSVRMIIIRSFNVNRKQNIPIDQLVGGVVGGSLLRGTLYENDTVTILPGMIIKNNDEQRFSYRPIISNVVSMKSEKNTIDKCIPGGLIAIQLTIDPAFTTQDGLVGNMLFVGNKKNKYKVYETLEIKYNMLNHDVFDPTNKDKELYRLHVNDTLIINCNSRDLQCRITSKSGSKKRVTVELNSPICAKTGDKIAISKKVSNSPKLIGQGTIKGGVESIQLG